MYGPPFSSYKICSMFLCCFYRMFSIYPVRQRYQDIGTVKIDHIEHVVKIPEAIGSSDNKFDVVVYSFNAGIG